MDKILYFAMLLAEEIRAVNDVFYDIGNTLFSLNYAYDMLWGTELHFGGKHYVKLKDLHVGMDVEKLRALVRKGEYELSAYVEGKEDGGNEEALQNLAGVLVGNDFLYEILYDYGMLGEKFANEAKNKAVRKLLKAVNKLADAFCIDLGFVDGRIYLRNQNRHLNDGTFICKTKQEVEAVCLLAKGKSILEARERSKMTEEQFIVLMERLKEHECEQTSG